MYARIELNQKPGGLSGIPTGFDELNKRTGGLQGKDLIVIAAETSQGKTSLALKFIYQAAINGVSAAIYSMEMKKEQLWARLLSPICGISVGNIERATFNGTVRRAR